MRTLPPLPAGPPQEQGAIPRAEARSDRKRVFSDRVTEWAASYSDLEPRSTGGQTLLSRLRFALEMLEAGAPPASKVLDVGCATGATAAEIMRRGYDVWGLDIAEPMIGYARDRLGSPHFQVGDIEDMPFRNDSFDAVVCLGVIEYLDTDERALHEVWRVLKPGGTAVLSTPSAICPLQHMDRLLVGLMAAARPLYHLVRYRLRGKPLPFRPTPGAMVHRKYYRRRWLRLLRSVGLEPEAWVCHGWGWYRSWPLDGLVWLLARQDRRIWTSLERWFGPAPVARASDRLARHSALNWVASEQLVRVRAVK